MAKTGAVLGFPRSIASPPSQRRPVSETSGSVLRVIRFAVFELDLRAGELRKAGVRLSLPAQSFHVLALLLERPGDLVTREELRERLWPTGTFVDFEHGLNAVVNRLRDTLGDSADRPRFIETVPRRGYRFVGTVERLATPPPAAVEPALRPSFASPTIAAFVRSQSHTGVTAAIGALLALAGGLWLFWRPPAVHEPPPKVVRLTTLAGTEDWPAFSPDGQQVAFGWDGEKQENVDIYVTLVGSTNVRRLTTDPAEDYAPSWSPDGLRVAFLREVANVAHIHVMSALGGPDLQVSDFPVAGTVPFSPAASQIAWSPDGRYIAAGRDPRDTTESSAGIYLIPVEGGPPRLLTRPKRPAFDFSPAFSPNGRRMAYASCGRFDAFSPLYYPTNCHVRVVDVDGTYTPVGPARRMTRDPADQLDGLAWTRDGQSVVFYQAGGGVDIWRLEVAGEHRPERIELAGRHTMHPATTGSQDRLVFSQYDRDAHLYRFQAGRPIEPVAPSSSLETDPHFSPDGRQIAFASGRSGDVTIWVAAADGSDARQLTHGTWTWQGSPHWSPDGRTIAFDAFDPDGRVHVWTIATEGGNPHRVTTHAGDQTVPTWSHDGKWIYFSEDQGGRRELWRIRASGGEPEQITRTGSGFLGIELADGTGTGLLYQPTNADSPLLLLPINGGPSRQLVDCVRSSAFATAGHTVVYVGCEPGSNPALHAFDTISGRDRFRGRLEKFEPDMPHVNLAVSPDGKTVLYRGVTRKGGDLMMIENFR